MRPSTMIAAGLLVGQGVVYIATPLLSRLYSPSEIGKAAAIMAASGIISAVATLRFELLLPGAPDHEVRWLARRGWLLLLVLSATLAPLAGLILLFSVSDTVITAITAIGIGGVALSLQTALRVQELRGVAASKAVQGVGQTAAQITFAAPAGSVGMQAGTAFGLLTASGVQTLSSRRRVRRLPVARPDASRLRSIIRRALLLTLAAACNAAVVAALPTITQVAFGAESTGQLAIAQRLALVPTGLAVAAVLPVVITQFGAQARSDMDASRAVVLRWLRGLVPLGVIATAVLLMAPLIPFDALLGEGWDGVGLYVAAMAPQIGAQLIAGPLSQCLVIQKRERTQLIWDISRLVAVFGTATLIVQRGGDALAMVTGVSVVLALAYGAHLWLVLAIRPVGRA